MKKLVVKSQTQIAELWDNLHLIKSYRVSTAKNGLSCEINSFCTPVGRLQVVEKIGDGYQIGTIFKARIATGEIWSAESHNLTGEPDDDLVLTRILWLDGLEESNLNTRERYVYLHGTNHEDKLGHPVSHGCIRFSNLDIVEIYEQLDVGAEVIVE